VLLQWSTPASLLTVSELLNLAPGLLGAGAVGMTSGPTGHDLVRLDGGRLATADGAAELAEVFQVRLFSPDVELRWAHTGSGRGPAVALSESGACPPGWAVDSVEVEEVLDGQYALWGRRFEALGAPGWCRAVEGRIGWIDVPAPTPASAGSDQDWPEQYLAMRFREYLTSDEYGNAAVLDERLIGIVVASAQFGGEDHR
jgi:CRISPR-associated protein (TIGR03984 family)